MKGKSVFGFTPWSKIHQPLPRTPRQSQQLLNALTSAFRRQLEKEHPSSSPPSEQNDNGNPPAVNPDSSVHATDKHMRSVLDHPLFRVVPSRSAHHSALPDITTEPMLYFDSLVARGSVNHKLLERCLTAQLLIATRNPENALKVMKESQAGSKITAWWFASGPEERIMLFGSRLSMRHLANFMVAEGLQGSFMAWLDLLAKGDIGGGQGPTQMPNAQDVYEYLLGYLVWAELKYGGGLPTGVQHCLNARKNLRDNGRAAIRAHGRALSMGVSFLNRKIKESPHGISADAYDELLELVITLMPHQSWASSLALYHPTRPNAIPYLQFMKGLDPDRRMKTPRVKSEMQSGFHGIRILMDQGLTQEAHDLAQAMERMIIGPGPEENRWRESLGWTTGEERNLLANLLPHASFSLT